MVDPGSEGGFTRRQILDSLLVLGTLGWLGSAAFPVLRYLEPLPQAGPGGPVHLSPEEVAQVAREHYTIVRAGSLRILVLQDEEESLYALGAKCTHEGCTVQFAHQDSVVWCACHNARFDLDGRVLAGPPPKPLPRYHVERTVDGGIVVRPVAT